MHPHPPDGQHLIFRAWKISEKSLSVTNIRSFKVEILYWTAILFSNTLGTALGDFLADDSGLVVDALDGAPGIYSARWAGENKDFSAAMARIERLLQERGASAPDKRKAHFVSALCVAWPDGHLEEVEARADGTLVWPPRGSAGFGYDPAFLPEGHTRTFGEMTSVEKHGLPPLGLGLSHRARAFVKLAEICLNGR